MSTVKAMARRVASRYLDAYRAQSDLEKVIGQFISRDFGITDAPKEFFDAVKEDVESKLSEDQEELDLKDPGIYDDLRRSIMTILDKMDMIKG